MYIDLHLTPKEAEALLKLLEVQSLRSVTYALNGGVGTAPDQSPDRTKEAVSLLVPASDVLTKTRIVLGVRRAVERALEEAPKADAARVMAWLAQHDRECCVCSNDGTCAEAHPWKQRGAEVGVPWLQHMACRNFTTAFGTEGSEE